MAEKIVRIVTVTGADDSIQPEELVEVADNFPFVEFGILLSSDPKGSTRFPSRAWLEELFSMQLHHMLQLSGHLCGSWVKDLCLGSPRCFDELDELAFMFDRFQLNFHAVPHVLHKEKFLRALLDRCEGLDVIFQIDGVNDGIFDFAKTQDGILARPLFDLSGGTGVLPKEWPRQTDGYSGYAGGLSPNNLRGQMEKIEEVASWPIWIDAETRLRSENDALFDTGKVWNFLSVAQDWVNGQDRRDH
ncbi:hypothetical protein M1432_02835 [Patescibacteria group bacterium]|nr:hypothetical protein [Patescibacteria group bacterium]